MSIVPKFWIVWSPTGTSSPRRRHESEDSARNEAERLARTTGAAEFFVCEAIGVAKLAHVEWSWALYPVEKAEKDNATSPDAPKASTDDADIPF